MRTPYLLFGLLGLLMLVTAGWFWRASTEAAPAASAASAAGAQASPHAEEAPGSRATPRRKSGFLASHEPGTLFTPDGENLTPSYHIEREALQQRLATAPGDTTALIRLARLLHDGHETEAAVTHYRRYLDLRPQGRQAWLDLAQCLGELAQWDAALEATQALLRHYPEDPAGLYNLGAVYANTARAEEARTVWQRVAAQAGDPEMRSLAEGALQRLGPVHP